VISTTLRFTVTSGIQYTGRPAHRHYLSSCSVWQALTLLYFFCLLFVLVHNGVKSRGHAHGLQPPQLPHEGFYHLITHLAIRLFWCESLLSLVSCAFEHATEREEVKAGASAL